MANLSKTFGELVKQGFEALGTISDPYQKALAAAELAKAVAQTGLVGLADEATPATPEEAAEIKEAIKKDDATATKKKAPAPKADKKAAPAPKKEEPKEEPVEEPVEEPTTDEEGAEEGGWTADALEKYAEELDFIAQLTDQYGEDGPSIMDECVQDWSEGVFKSTEDITPDNIVGFKAYLEMLLADAGE